MAFQFPINPTVGQSVLNPTSSQYYTWNGTAWTQYPTSASYAISSSYSVTSSYAVNGGGGGATISISDNAPTGSQANTGSLWFNSNNLGLYVRYQDQDSTQWVAASAVGPVATASIAFSSSFSQTAVSSSFATTASFAQSASLAEKSKFFFLQAYSTASYTLPGAFTQDTCRYNVVDAADNVPAAWFNTATYRFTPQKAGYWQITATYDIYRGSSTNEASIQILKNFFVFSQASSLGAINLTTTRIIYLNGTTDYIQIVNSGAATQARTQDAAKSWFQAIWIGE